MIVERLVIFVLQFITKALKIFNLINDKILFQIIIAGGTMQPTAELTDQLFKTCSERVHLKFYDHVVSSDAVLPFVVSKGPTGKKFCFNFTSRNSTEMVSQ